MFQPEPKFQNLHRSLIRMDPKLLYEDTNSETNQESMAAPNLGGKALSGINMAINNFLKNQGNNIVEIHEHCLLSLLKHICFDSSYEYRPLCFY